MGGLNRLRASETFLLVFYCKIHCFVLHYTVMYRPEITKNVRVLILLALTVFIWAILVMVYTDQFVPPFDFLSPLLMPWKQLGNVPPDANVGQRLAFLQNLINGSNRVAQYSLVTMLISFAAFSIYLSVLYQQKQRRARENMFLTLKNQEIARRNEFIRYISATIGHEFKNNLGRIKRRIDLLSSLPPDSHARINDNLDKLFADIDIFKKISDEREAGLAEFKKIDLKAMLQELARQYGDLAEIVMSEKVVTPKIYGSPQLLKTVFENLIDNAVKYKKPEQTRARIRISCSTDTDGGRRYVTVLFRDEGIGMDDQQADRCFYKGRGEGENWGQGLYFAKYVVGLHAGRIRIGKDYTVPGVGTELIINLPFVEEALDV